MTTNTYIIPLNIYPDVIVSLALFRDVDNAKELLNGVLKGLFEATLLKPSLIVDPFQVIVAANKAVHQQKINKLMTKTVHSEILFSLSPRKNISNAFKTFGMGDRDSSVFVAILNDHDKSTLSTIQELVRGRQVDPSQVSELTNLQTVKEIYNLSETEMSVSNILDSVVSRIASKDIVQV